MPSIRARADNQLLFFDFRWRGVRCRELTLLQDTPANRKKLQKVLDRIESEIAAGAFVYERYFPESKAIAKLAKSVHTRLPGAEGGDSQLHAQASTASLAAQAAAPAAAGPPTPSFASYSQTWLEQHRIEWRRSHVRVLESTLKGHLIPHFGQQAVGSITKSDILAFRTVLAKVPGRAGREGLSSKRINEIVGTLCRILEEAADQFQFTPPGTHIKRLRVRKSDVQPLSLAEVQRLLATVRADYRPYFTVRLFTGMRTGEVHGLKWKYVDFERRQILIRETFVLGEDEYTKTDASQRDIRMSEPVFEALQEQHQASGKLSEYVFCNLAGEPLDNKNVAERVWYPLLRHLGLEPRRPYQMRHTAATLWLAAGEAPEWIARQLGHANTEMLFRVYSRFVPNLTRRDGSAMDMLLASKLATGKPGAPTLLLAKGAQGLYQPSVTAEQPVPKPRGLNERARRLQALRRGDLINAAKTSPRAGPISTHDVIDWPLPRASNDAQGPPPATRAFRLPLAA